MQLINDGSTVLATQQASSAAILDFSKNLSLLSGTLKAHDSDVATILDRGTLASAQVTKLLQDNRSGISTLLTNLVTVGQVTASNNAGLRQILVTYPDTVAGAYTVLPGDGTAHFGLVLNLNDPAPCLQGYGGTHRTDPGADHRTCPPLNTARPLRRAERFEHRRPWRPARPARLSRNLPRPGSFPGCRPKQRR